MLMRGLRIAQASGASAGRETEAARSIPPLRSGPPVASVQALRDGERTAVRQIGEIQTGLERGMLASVRVTLGDHFRELRPKTRALAKAPAAGRQPPAAGTVFQAGSICRPCS